MRSAATLLAAALLAAGPAKDVVLPDPPCGDPDRATSDVREVRILPGAGGLDFAVRRGGPLEKGMFTCVHALVDADDDPATGIGGDELLFRAALGSRFHPNGWKPADPAIPAPMENRLLSWSEVVRQETAGAAEAGRTWMLHDLPGAPAVEGDVIRFTLPAALLSRGTEWIGAGISLRVEVETWCGDQPLLVDHVAADEGLPIVVDGNAREWSGEEPDEDPAGELHPTLPHLDLVRLRVDHDGPRLFACLEVAGRGFAERAPPSPDLSRQETLHVLAEPVDSSYESPRRIVVPRGVPSTTRSDGSWSAAGTTVEIALPRTGLDARTRVLAWSEGRFVDRVPDRGSVKLPRRSK